MVEPGGNFILVNSPKLVPTPEQIEADLQELEQGGPVIAVGRNPFKPSVPKPPITTPFKGKSVMLQAFSD